MRWSQRRMADKDVTVIIELRARFDEEANIELSNRLQEAGAHVMYGVVGYKTHAKMTLVVRREADGIRRYCHLGTGNYHPSTARAYTDYGLFTCDEDIGTDVHEIFLQLTSLTRTPQLRRLLQSPFHLHEAVQALIERESAHARAGKTARIIVKLNALVDPQTIETLYRASRSGVQHRSDRARRVRRCGPASRACPRTSACARWSAASSSTRASTGSRTAASQRAVSGQRRLDGAQLLPPRRGRLPGAAQRLRERITKRSGNLSGRQHQRLGAADRRHLRARRSRQ